MADPTGGRLVLREPQPYPPPPAAGDVLTLHLAPGDRLRLLVTEAIPGAGGVQMLTVLVDPEDDRG